MSGPKGVNLDGVNVVVNSLTTIVNNITLLMLSSMPKNFE